jgi:Ca2+-binding EF-hand superfamily protein
MISPTSTLGQSGEELLKASRSLRFNPNKTLSLDATIGSIGTPPGTAAQDPKTPSAKARSPTGGAPNNPEFDGFLRLAGPITPLAAMMAFRKVLIEKYHSMEEAVKLLCAELDDPNVMTKKDYRRYLQKYALNLSREERDAVYSHLDLDGDGDVSMAEMDLAIQAASPVRDLFDLRRRLLAGGISSLGQALRIADNVGISLTDRLSLRQFGEGLYHLHVSEHEEHLVLFNAVLDPNDPHSRVALPELIAALATLSPAMLVEDVREKLRRGKYDGNFERAFADLDLDQRGWVEKEDFVENAVLRFGLQEYEAKKMYRQIDVDESGRITRKEFLSSMALSEPNLFLEELRRKVLQRFRSIQTAFTKAFVAEIMAQEEDKKEGRDAKPLAGTLEKFQEMLLEVGLSEEETARLFSLIDIDGTGSLTVVQFVKGTLMFAPSWAFEDLRLQCLARNHEVAEIFADVEVSTTLALDLEAFSEILKELGLAEGVDVLAIFDMLDVMHDGQTTLGKLVAALQAGGPGTAIRLSDDDVVVYSKHDARNCTNSANRLVTDLKSLVRQNIDYSSTPVEVEDKDVISPSERARQERLAMVESMPLGSLRKSVAEKMKRLFGSSGGLNSGNQAGQRSTSTTDSAASSGGTSPKGRTKKIMSMGHRSPAQNDKSENERKKENENPRKATPAILKKVPPEDIKYYLLHQATYPAAGPPKPPPNPRNPQESYTPSMNMMGDNQTAWNQVWNRLHTASGQKDRQELEKEIHNYFQAGTWRLSHDVPLLEKVESRHAVHTDARRHAHALETEKQKIVYKAEKQAAAGSETRA